MYPRVTLEAHRQLRLRQEKDRASGGVDLDMCVLSKAGVSETSPAARQGGRKSG